MLLLGSITGGGICENLKPLCLKILIQYPVKRLKKVTTKPRWGQVHRTLSAGWMAMGAEPHRYCTSPTRTLSNNLAFTFLPKKGEIKINMKPNTTMIRKWVKADPGC